jgi:hypothetical protein
MGVRFPLPAPRLLRLRCLDPLMIASKLVFGCAHDYALRGQTRARPAQAVPHAIPWWIALTLALASSAVSADYGTAVFVTGSVGLVQSSGQTAALAKGTQVKSGDQLRLGASGRAQIRFRDGAFLSLMPGAELRIDAYRFGGAAKGKEAAFFTLFRGAARFLAGAIGAAPGSRFRVTTPMAAIDVELGGFVAIVGKGLQVNVGAGRVILRNDAGTLTVDAGQRAYVAERNRPPYLIGTAIPERIAP